MAMLDRKGTFLANPKSWGIKVEEGKCPRFAMVFQVSNELRGGEVIDVEGDLAITGFFTLVNKDGSPNEINLNALRDALGWDGQNFASLDTGAWGGKQVQIVVDDHEYQGKKTLEVKYLNPKDYTGNGGGVQRADPQVVQSLDQKYGAMLRAVFKKNGTKPAAAPKAPVTVAANPADAAKGAAWAAFMGKTTDYDPAKRAIVFKKLVAEMFVGKQPADLAAADWQWLQSEIEKSFSVELETIIPF